MADDIHAQLRRLIGKSGLGLRELAALSGVDPGQLSRFLNSKQGLGSRNMAAVCRTLDLELRPKASKRPRTRKG